MQTETNPVWLESYPDEISASMTYEERSLHSYLKESAENYPDKQALHFMGTTMSYKTVYSYSLKVANQLQAEGIQKGDRVALMLANSPQSVICYYGALLAGAIVVQTNPLYVEREVEHQLMDSGAKIMICLDLVFPRVDAVRQNTQLEKVIVTSIKDFLPFPKNILYPLVQKKNSGIKVDVSYDSQTVHFKTWLEQGSEKEPEVAVNPKEDLALLQYTGGTTGPAKGVMLTHYNLVVNTLQSRAWMYKMEKGNERILAVLPFFHVYGMTAAMNIAIMYASSLIILPKFEPKQVLKTIQKQKVTLFPGAPTMYIGLIHDPDIDKYDLSSIKACLSGSAPLPKEVQDTFEKITGGKLVEGYGLTETSPVAAANPIWAKSKTGSIGIPWPDTEMAIYSSEGEGFAPAGEIGEIVIKGPQVMQGYWNRPEETQATLKDGWFFSGDMGYMDEDGFFYIVDRKKDMIIAGGFNIYPREIEEVLYEHESIQEAAVIGVPDPYRGETVKAFIVLKDGAATTEKEIEDFCRKQLAAFKVPKQVEFREELPKTMVGKVLRRVLVEEEEAKAFANAQEKEGS